VETICEAERCEPDRPIIAIRYEDGRVQITRQDEEQKIIVYQGHEDVRGKWLDFRIAVHFSSTADGSIEATLDRRLIVEYEGPTLFNRDLAILCGSHLLQDGTLPRCPPKIAMDDVR
jgi:hypothetical protein